MAAGDDPPGYCLCQREIIGISQDLVEEHQFGTKEVSGAKKKDGKTLKNISGSIMNITFGENGKQMYRSGRAIPRKQRIYPDGLDIDVMVRCRETLRTQPTRRGPWTPWRGVREERRWQTAPQSPTALHSTSARVDDWPKDVARLLVTGRTSRTVRCGGCTEGLEHRSRWLRRCIFCAINRRLGGERSRSRRVQNDVGSARDRSSRRLREADHHSRPAQHRSSCPHAWIYYELKST
jgi:hypothetical protein